MNLEWSLLIAVISVVFSAGVAWGIVKSSLNHNNNKIDKLEKKMEAIGNFDDIVRKYLFAPDHTNFYVPTVTCEKQSAILNKKMDRIIEILVDRENHS